LNPGEVKRHRVDGVTLQPTLRKSQPDILGTVSYRGDGQHDYGDGAVLDGSFSDSEELNLDDGGDSDYNDGRRSLVTKTSSTSTSTSTSKSRHHHHSKKHQVTSPSSSTLPRGGSLSLRPKQAARSKQERSLSPPENLMLGHMDNEGSVEDNADSMTKCPPPAERCCNSSGRFVCTFAGCKKTYARNEHLGRHLKCHIQGKVYVCSLCHKRFDRTDSLVQHQKIHLRDDDLRN